MKRPTRPHIVAKSFDESKINRDNDGKFATKPGGGTTTMERPAKPATKKKRKGRPGGEKRGNSTDRRRRKEWMLKTWGDGESCPCVHCEEPLHYETVEADRIDPGGSYRRDNVQPSCRGCNLARSDDTEWQFSTSVMKHFGPGPHANGTPQSIHGKKGAKGLLKEAMTKPEGEQGYTYDRRKNEFLTEGFALSVFPQHETIVSPGPELKEGVDAFVDKHWDWIRERDDVYYGAWVNPESGEVELDLSIIVQDQEEAIKLAYEHEQEGIYDLKANTTIYTRAREGRVAKHRGTFTILGTVGGNEA